MLDRGSLEGRFDPIYYTESLTRLLKHCPFEIKTLKEAVLYAKSGFASGKTDQADESGVIQIRPTNMDEHGLLKFDKNIYVPLNLLDTKESLKKNEILFNNTNSQELVGKTAYFDLEGNYFCSNHITRIACNDSVYPKYLWVLLNLYQRHKVFFNTCTNWNNQSGVNVELLKSYKIPFPPKGTQQTIVDLMDSAYATKKSKEAEAKKLLDSIDAYLLDELGITLPPYPSSSLDERVFEIDFEYIFGGRLDGLSHKPFYADSIEAIKKSSKNYNYALLRDLITHSISGDWGDDEKNITNYDDYTQCLVLRATEIDNNYGLNIDGERKKYRFLKNTKIDKLNTCVNDILIEKSGGSPDQPVGRVALLTVDIFENDVIAFSNFMHKIRLNERIQAEFAFNCLRTFYNKKITENMQSQTNGIRNLIMSEFLHIPMPLPKPKIQEQISQEIKLRRDEAKKLQSEAKELLDQAKKEVEKIILGEVQ